MKDIKDAIEAVTGRREISLLPEVLKGKANAVELGVSRMS